MGMWDKGVVARSNKATWCTLVGEVATHDRYKETGCCLENGGCEGDPHIVPHRCLIFLCILHSAMAMGCLQVAFIEVCLADLPKETTEAI